MARYYRKIIKISALMSPNVRLALKEIAEGKEPSGRILVPGVLTYDDYLKRRATWDAVRQCIGLDGEFYQGAEVLLFPPEWLNRAELLARDIEYRHPNRRAKAIGIDPAEGGDRTAMAAVDELGLIELTSEQTPDTSKITGKALAFMSKHRVPAGMVAFDRGGGGKEHADRLRSQGHQVRTVAFGESLTLDPVRRLRQLNEKLDNKEEHYAYKNRRAEMYGDLSGLLDPAVSPGGFAIPAGTGSHEYDPYTRLRRQLSVFPKDYDNEGRMILPPKNNKTNPESKKKSLTEMIGHSPDEADALVLAVYAMTHKKMVIKAGAVV